MEQIFNKSQEKWDWLLPQNLLGKNYASQNLDIPGAQRYLDEPVSLGSFNSYGGN